MLEDRKKACHIRWWTLTRVVLKFKALEGSFNISAGMNLNKSCIEIIKMKSTCISTIMMNLNKSCIEIGVDLVDSDDHLDEP